MKRRLILFFVAGSLACVANLQLSAHAEEATPIPPALASPAAGLYFRHLSTADGLPPGSVNAVLQDRSGFVWFGTNEGLVRYDGYRMSVLRHQPDDPGSLSSNVITALLEDSKGAIWVGTRGGGLNRFDPQRGRFVHYQLMPDAPPGSGSLHITALAQDPGGKLWVASADRSLAWFDLQSEHFRRAALLPCDLASPILKMVVGSSGLLWLLAGALYRFDPQQGRSDCFRLEGGPAAPGGPAPPARPNDAPPLGFFDLLEDPTGQLWLAGHTGLFNFDPQREQFSLFKPSPQFAPIKPPGANELLPAVSPLTSLFQDQTTGLLWVGSVVQGLYVFDPRSRQFVAQLNNNPVDPYSLSDGPVVTMLRGRDDILWIGLGNGVDFLNLRQTAFTSYRRNPLSENSFLARPMRAITQDRNGIIWIGAAHYLTRFDRAQGTFRHYNPLNGPRPPGRSETVDIASISADATGAIWFDGVDGIYRFDPQRESFERFRPTDSPERPFLIQQMAEDRSGDMWALLADEPRLYRFDRATKAFSAFELPGDARDPATAPQAVYVDQQDNVWVASSSILQRLDRRSGQFQEYRFRAALPEQVGGNQVGAIYGDASGILWLGKEIGLLRFDPRSGESRLYSEADGLPRSLIEHIAADRQGRLWLMMRQGIVRFDPQNSRARVLSPNDGLEAIGESWLSAYQSPEGELLIIGKSLLTFFPEQISEYRYEPPTLLTDFQLFNRPVPIGADSLLQQPIWLTDSLALNYAQNSVSFEFATLRYAASTQARYRYRLDGVDEGWNEVDSTRRFVTYGGLQPGQYVFRVQGQQNDGNWNEATVALRVVISPPWWATWWFRGTAVLVLAALGLGAIGWRLRSLEQQRRQLELLVAERTRDLAVAKAEADEANQAKSEFLSSMSHELRTPLNGILGYAQVLQRSPGDPALQREGLQTISDNGRHLLTLIDDVLDLAKVEAQRLDLEHQPIELLPFLESISGLMQNIAQQKQLVFLAQYDPALPQYILADPKRLRQVLLNLLGNAIKFSERGSVFFRVKLGAPQQAPPATHEQLLRFEVEDTGPGIAADALARIFEPFEQLGDAQLRSKGTGLGLTISRRLVELMGGQLLVESEPGRGSLFWFEALFMPMGLATPLARPQPRIVGYAGTRRHVLIADDYVDNRMVLRQLLEPLGFTITLAENGLQALEAVQQQPPDIVLIDMMMPVLTGFEAVQAMRQLPQLAELPIIAVSASVWNSDEEQSRRAGCTGFLRKPVEAEQLFALLQEQLQLTWQYADEADEVAAAARQEDLRLPPDVDLAVLYELACDGNMERIGEWARQLEARDPVYGPFAQQVAALAAAFDDLELQQLARAHLVRPAVPEQRLDTLKE